MVGEAPLARDLAGRLIDALHRYDEQEEARERARPARAARARGARARRRRPNREIAGSLGISEFTVKRHMQNIREARRAHPHAASEFYRTVFPVERELDALEGLRERRIGLAEERPLVALVCQVPLIAEAISSALEEIAEVRVFPGARRHRRPPPLARPGRRRQSREAEAATSFVREAGIPLVEISLVDQRLRVLGIGWLGGRRRLRGDAGGDPERPRRAHSRTGGDS